MSHRVWNPKRGMYVDATKQGTAGSKQVWYDKVHGEEFRTERDQTTRQEPSTNRESMHRMSTNPYRVRKTSLMWNNNVIKTVDGNISEDDAVELLGAHFREVSRNNLQVEYLGDEKRIKAVMNSGSKS